MSTRECFKMPSTKITNPLVTCDAIGDMTTSPSCTCPGGLMNSSYAKFARRRHGHT